MLPIGKARGRARAVTPSTKAVIREGSHGGYKLTARREDCGEGQGGVHFIASRLQMHPLQQLQLPRRENGGASQCIDELLQERHGVGRRHATARSG